MSRASIVSAAASASEPNGATAFNTTHTGLPEIGIKQGVSQYVTDTHIEPERLELLQ